MPPIYQTVFGGNPVAPAIPTYLPLTFAVNTILGWPLESNITSPAVAEWIDCTASAPALTLQLSDARSVSTGYTTIFNNVGANTFSVLDAQGNVLMSPASGAAWILVLADNSTLQGTWRTLQLGAGVSAANAATLAGSGLKAITTTLNERILINPQAVNYPAVASDRASCLDWTGGSGGIFTIDPVGLGSDWFCYIKNSGTGVLTVAPASGTVDGSANKTLNPNDSCIVLSTGANLFTIGFGQSVASSFNFVTISLAGASGTVVLTGAQLNRISYKFTGALAGNTTVQVPASIQQYWVDNETTGAFTLTISAGGVGSTFVVPQSSRVILYCDGLNIVSAVSAGAGSTTLVADGTAAAPGLAWASDPQMGLYKAGVDVLGISTAGIQRGSINASGQWIINAPSAGVAVTLNGVNGGASLVINSANGGAGSASDVNIFRTGSTANTLGEGPSIVLQDQTTPTATLWQHAGGQSELWQFNSGVWNQILRVLSTRGLILNSPAGGPTFTVTGVAGASGVIAANTADGHPALNIIGPAATQLASFAFAQTGQSTWQVYQPASNSDFRIFGNAADRLIITNAGVVTLPSGGQPAFYATENSGQTLNAGATTTLIFNTSQFNQGANYNTGTGVFTAPVAGLYLFTCNLWLQNNAAGSASVSVWLSINSAAVGLNQVIPINTTFNPAGQPAIFPGSFVLKLNANDTVRINATIATNNIQHGSAGSNQSSFCGYLLG